MRIRTLSLVGILTLAGLFTVLGDGKGRTQQQPPFAAPTLPADSADLVREFLVTPAVGPWMICVASYEGPEAMKMAREFVQTLRDPHGPYKLQAYVFNRGSEERKKEQDRVEQLKKKQREEMEKLNKELHVEVHEKMKIYYKKMRQIEDQCAILVGGFKDMASARRYLDVIKKMQQPDPTKVKLAATYVMSSKGGEMALVNPFLHSFVVPNPTVPLENAAMKNTAPDPFLKQLNANERYSLLKSPRAVTLLVKQYQGATLVQPQTNAGGMMSKLLGNGSINGQTLDKAGESAHNLAEIMNKTFTAMGLNKKGMESYVLHTRYNSMVTVGSFDTNDEQSMRRARETLAQLQPQFTRLNLNPEPVPILVPRP